MSDLRAGLIGLGMMGRNHARVLAHTDGIDLVGVADPLGDVHEAARGATVHTDPMDLINSDLDICVVAAPTEDHEQLGLALAEAGIHALIEKPLAMTVDAAQRLASAFEKAGLIGAVGHIERFNPALRQLRMRLDNGDLGEPYQISTMRCGPFPGRIRDVGVIKDLATHDVDLTAWVAGSEFTSISAQTAFKSGRKHEDLVAATGMLANGVVTNHQVNWLSPMKQRQTVVTGERGAFVADTLTGDLTFHENGIIETTWDAVSAFRGVAEGNVTRFAFAKKEPLATEHEAFRDAVLGADPVEIVTMRQGLAAVAVAEAMIQSAAAEGERVKL